MTTNASEIPEDSEGWYIFRLVLMIVLLAVGFWLVAWQGNKLVGVSCLIVGFILLFSEHGKEEALARRAREEAFKKQFAEKRST